MKLSEVERILQTYTLEEILELNEKTEEETLIFLVSSEFISLPDILPVDYDQTS